MTNAEFTDLLKPHYNDAVNYCRALCSGSAKAEAEEILQQALLKAFEKIGSLKDKAKFRSWFFQIITRCFYDAVRKPFWSRFVSLNSEKGAAAFTIYEDDYFDENQELIGALSKLEKKERAALLLFEIGGFSIKEITGMQNENSESAVKSRLSRARKKLKEFMVLMENGPVSGESLIHAKNVKAQNIAPPQKGPGSAYKTKDIYHETIKVINEIKSLG